MPLKNSYRKLIANGLLFSSVILGAAQVAASMHIVAGDVAPQQGTDGVLALEDYVRVQRHVLGIERLDAVALLAADVAPAGTGDGRVDTADLLFIGQALGGIRSLHHGQYTLRPRSTSSSSTYDYQYFDEPGSTGVAQRQINGPRDDLAVDDITTTDYDRAGNVTRVSNALGHTIVMSDYNGRGQVGKIVDANNVTTQLQYDPRGWLLSYTVKHPVFEDFNATTAFEYDAIGQLVKVTMPDDSFIGYEYDVSKRLVAIYNALGERIEYSLNAAGGQVTETICSGNLSNQAAGCEIQRVQTRVFDGLKRLRKSLNSSGQARRIDYDKNNNPNQLINRKGHATYQAFDAFDQLVEKVEPDQTPADLLDNPTTFYSYDQIERVQSVTDPRGLQTVYEYNAFGELDGLSSPDTGATRYTYDNAGNRTSRLNAGGTEIYYRYDPLNRLTHVIAPSNPEQNITYIYDDRSPGNFGVGRLAYIYDQSGITRYWYDHRGNVIKKKSTIDGVEYQTSYRYTLADQVASMSYPSGRRVSYAYDSAGQITEVFNNDSPVVNSLRYKPYGPLSAVTFANGIGRTIVYDQDYRLTNIIDRGSAELLNLRYVFDENSNISELSDVNDVNNNQRFSFDEVERVKTAHGAYGSISYDYDKISNRLSRQHLGTETPLTENYRYEPLSNRLIDVTAREGSDERTRSFLYDEAGNVKSDTRFSGDLYELLYNDHNRLVQLSKNGEPTAVYQYNALGQRVSKSVSGSVQHFHYDESGRLLAMNVPGAEHSNEFIYANKHRLARVVTDRDSASIEYFHNDHLGRPLALTDASAQLIWRGQYLPFGSMRVILNATDDQELGFPGQLYDRESSYWYNYFRDYDASLGRYIQSDPTGLAGGINTYSYAYQNALLYVDPYGLLNFYYHGNWGGPGRVNGQQYSPPKPRKGPPRKEAKGWREADDFPREGDEGWVRPRDDEDWAYYYHDTCLNDCQSYKCEELAECEAQCDRDLANNPNVPFQIKILFRHLVQHTR